MTDRPQPREKPKPLARLKQCNKANRLYRRYVRTLPVRKP